MRTQNMARLQTQLHSPTTPELQQGKWAANDESKAPELVASPSSVYSLHTPETPISPTTPQRIDYQSILDGKAQRDNYDTPVQYASKASLQRQVSLQRQASLHRQTSLRRPPAKVGELILGRQIGSGSFSKIYEAHGTSGVYAVKIRLSSTPEEVFQSEMKVLLKLTTPSPHPNIAEFYPELSGEEYCVLKKYDSSLDELVRSSKYLPNPNSMDFYDYRVMTQPVVGLKVWCEWATQLISGLKRIHSRNIVHGDLKPDNVLVSGDNLAISDFSGAIDLSLNQVLRPEIQEFAWSPVFTDPNLRNGIAEPSFASDIYALGLVLAFCATGKEPFNTAKNATQRLLWMDKMSPLDSFEMDDTQRLKLIRPMLELLLNRSWDGVDEALNALKAST